MVVEISNNDQGEMLDTSSSDEEEVEVVMVDMDTSSTEDDDDDDDSSTSSDSSGSEEEFVLAMPLPVEEAAIPDPMGNEPDQVFIVLADGGIMVVRPVATNPGDYVTGAELHQILDQMFQEGQHEGGVPPMSSASIQALETKVVDESHNGNCPVCVDSFQIGDQLLLPSCNASNQHACHPACLQGWLARHSTCPVCRQTLAIEEEEEGYDGGDESDDGPNEED